MDRDFDLTYRITFSVTGRARFLSHLETVDTLLSALRRGGFDIALSKGMKPRPVISLALPRAVGVESLAELADIEIVGDPPPEELSAALEAQLPAGVAVRDVAPAAGKPAASRVDAVRYSIEVGGDLDWSEGARRFLAASEARVVRRSPKGEREVDVRQFCRDVRHHAGQLVAELELTGAGTARPEEVATCVAAQLGATPTVRRVVREAISLREPAAGAIE
jgi:radical SAM-linked protein